MVKNTDLQFDQIVLTVNEAGKEYLKYTENVSKNNPGGAQASLS